MCLSEIIASENELYLALCFITYTGILSNNSVFASMFSKSVLSLDTVATPL